jgi:imidazolonepropionase-like amidohydrolase
MINMNREERMSYRRWLLRIGLVAVILAGVGCSPGSTPVLRPTLTRTPVPAVTLALVNGTLIDGTGADAIPDAVVLVAGERIAYAGPGTGVTVPAGVPTIDVRGGTILPGFINAHVHFAFNEANLKAWAQGGVTTVRDESAGPGQTPAGIVDFRAKAARDPQNARLVSAGQMITVPGGYGYLYVSSPEEARQKTLAELDAGIDLIKVSLEDGYAGRSGLPKLTAEELAAIVTAAHARGTRVSGHITQAAYLAPMLAAGVDDIAHVPYDTVPSETLRKMVDQGTFLVPTFTVYRNFGAPVETCQANLREFVKLGGKVALGNDYGGGPGQFELGIPLYEVEMMAGAGMTPMQILVAATSNAAQVLNLGKEIGSLEPGKAADILVVAGDPLADLKALADVRVVVHGGAVIRDELGT